jgi:hypothetical protein
MRGQENICSSEGNCEEMIRMKKRLGFIYAALLLLPASAFAQQPPQIPFQVSVVGRTNQPAPALQSFAFAIDGDKWLLIGGRTNGFHRTSTREATFPTANSNQDVYVVDLTLNRAWKAPLPNSLLYQLSSTNMEFYQDGGALYLVGGYGSNCGEDKPECYQTFPNLTAIKVHQLVQAIIAGQKDISPYIVSITDDRMKVTGGELLKLGNNFYLVFGQDFEGIYKGGITGKYTEQVRRFQINFDGARLSIANYQAFNPPDGGGVDSQYHRRDLNVVESIRPSTSVRGLTAYGGVFTKTAGAWTNPVNLDQDAAGNTRIAVDTGFNQKMSQYSCARVLMFSASRRTMFTTLLGGISLYYYDDKGKLVPSNIDNFMPFINSITTLARFGTGQTVEWPQPPSIALPELMGANAVFIPVPGIPLMPGTHEVINYDRLPPGRTLVGYLYGGIHATAPQVSFINPSYASSTIYGVFVLRTAAAKKAVHKKAK